MHFSNENNYTKTDDIPVHHYSFCVFYVTLQRVKDTMANNDKLQQLANTTDLVISFLFKDRKEVFQSFDLLNVYNVFWLTLFYPSIPTSDVVSIPITRSISVTKVISWGGGLTTPPFHLSKKFYILNGHRS